MDHGENRDDELDSNDARKHWSDDDIPNDPDATSGELLDAVRKGDPEAWRDFARTYNSFVQRQCRKAGLNPHDCEDVCQEVLKGVHRNLSRFDNDGKAASFRRWLYTIVDRRIKDLLRKKQVHPDAPGGSDRRGEIPDPHGFPEPSGTTNPLHKDALERLNEVAEHVKRLVSPTTWGAFYLTTVDGLTSAEAAGVLNMTANAVRLARARVFRLFRTWDRGDDTPGAAMPAGA